MAQLLKPKTRNKPRQPPRSFIMTTPIRQAFDTLKGVLCIILLPLLLAVIYISRVADQENASLKKEKIALQNEIVILKSHITDYKKQLCFWKVAAKPFTYWSDRVRIPNEPYDSAERAVLTPADLTEAKRQIDHKELGSQQKDLEIQFLRIDLKNAQEKAAELEKKNVDTK